MGNMHGIGRREARESAGPLGPCSLGLFIINTCYCCSPVSETDLGWK